MALGGSNAMRHQANALSYRTVTFVENRGHLQQGSARQVRDR